MAKKNVGPGRPSKGERVSVTIRLPKDVARGFRVSAFVEGISQSDLMLRLARDHLAKHPPPPLMPPAEQARKVREYKRTSSRKK